MKTVSEQTKETTRGCSASYTPDPPDEIPCGDVQQLTDIAVCGLLCTLPHPSERSIAAAKDRRVNLLDFFFFSTDYSYCHAHTV
ncbi:hypothetical protein SRHO_G00047400 [Serrasalmus rhombeus]